jgi:predicted molibdopterin-dependent oxidoreductase YjgC
MGGGTSSYQEIEETDCILLWGSNARETHPIFFHHLLAGLKRGAKLYAIDPRRTASAQWADVWAGLDVGTDIALSNTMAREIIASGLAHREFIEHATTGFEDYGRLVEPWTLARGAAETGVPAPVIREMAHTYAKAKRAIICWTLGITEHHTAVHNVMSLINLALLTGHVGRWGSGLNPLRGQNNVQGGGDMGALPDRLPGFQHVENDEVRAKFDRFYGTAVPPKKGWHLSDMFDAMERRDLRALYVIGENPVQSEADQHRATRLLEGLDCLVVQDIFLTETAQRADVVFPAAAGAFESEGTVTNSERRVQRVRKTLNPPGEAREDLAIICDLARKLGHDWTADAESVWNEVRQLSPVHAGMSYARLEQLSGLQWPCYDDQHPGELFLHGRLWERPVRGPRAPFSLVRHELPLDQLDADFPLRLTTGRRLEEYNTGVQTGSYASPTRRGETIDVSPEDARRLNLVEGQSVRVTSRRGAVVAPVHIDEALRPGLTFMTFHFPDDVATNMLTSDATDPLVGTAEFKATAVRIEPGVGNRESGTGTSSPDSRLPSPDPRLQTADSRLPTPDSRL